MTRYTIHVAPNAWAELQNLPGNMKQRARKAIEELRDDPRPSNSKMLEVTDLEFVDEVRRIRIDRWRIIYAVSIQDGFIDILAVRKRPPYDYADLVALIEKLG